MAANTGPAISGCETNGMGSSTAACITIPRRMVAGKAPSRRHLTADIFFPRREPATTLLLRSQHLVAAVDCYHSILHHL
ncbi:hypothetical protein F2Q70_00028929 [Brassica cretica]|uniref:Uncharacterized protein n=2 Tax=Brassica cretica TaxID=69181 RepID=A0A3N6RJD1_BRACR|nr:hypothetical protein F2Q68_00028492 [Brassica cretica]KAF2602900.1 hypothetical protein F2Q70_00028929 [Brassica cretica]KAF3579986.1 hypothetical protein DY000_02036106 [Brassica cretica]